MDNRKFTIAISNSAVHVELDPGPKAGSKRRNTLLLFSAFTLLLGALFFFIPGRQQSPSMWQDMHSKRHPNNRVVVPAFMLGYLIFAIVGTRRYIVATYPSAESLRTETGSVVISKIRWFDFGDKDWVTRSYPISSVKNLRYAVVGRTGGKGAFGAVKGLRFSSNGKSVRALPGISKEEADKVMTALEQQGATLKKKT